jgi:hypothetical protein
VPAGIFNETGPCKVGTSRSAPPIASEDGDRHFQIHMLILALENVGRGFTRPVHTNRPRLRPLRSLLLRPLGAIADRNRCRLEFLLHGRWLASGASTAAGGAFMLDNHATTAAIRAGA